MKAFIVLLKKEFLQIRRNSFLPKLILAFPIIQMIFAPMIMTMDVKNVNVAVVDLDRSTCSSRIISHINASDYLSLGMVTSQYTKAMIGLEDGNIDVIVQIPKHFERDMTISSPEKISITTNAVNATKGSMGTQYLIQTIAKSMMEIRGDKYPFTIPDIITVQNKYNPTLNYSHNMIPAVMIIIFILICGFLPALSIVGEKEAGTIEQINVTPVGKLTFTLAKLIPYWIIGLFVLSIAMLVAKLVHGLTPIGSVGLIYLGAALFILTISGFSLTISNFSDTMQQTMFVMFFFIMIFMLMSGLLTPIDSMPAWAQMFTTILPPRYFIEILRSVYLKGTTFVELSGCYIALSISATICSLAAALTYKKQV